MPEHTEDRERGSTTAARVGGAFSGLIRFAITAVRIIGAVFALILAIYIVLYVFEANPDNPVTEFFDNVSGGLVIWFDDLFTPENDKVQVLVNYGIAAIFWLVAAAIVARILQAVGR